MANQARSKSRTRRGHLTPTRSPINLSIHGEDVFLEGRFHRWQVATTVGHDLDELAINMAVDVTSPDQLTAPDARGDLFSFRATMLSELRPHAYMARGQLVTPAGERPFEMLVEVPAGHTAFLILSFVVRKDELGDGWKELLTGGPGHLDIDAERRLDPRMGVRDLELAAA